MEGEARETTVLSPERNEVAQRTDIKEKRRKRKKPL